MHSFPLESFSCVRAARRDVSGKCQRLGTLRGENAGKLKKKNPPPTTSKPPPNNDESVSPCADGLHQREDKKRSQQKGEKRGKYDRGKVEMT